MQLVDFTEEELWAQRGLRLRPHVALQVASSWELCKQLERRNGVRSGTGGMARKCEHNRPLVGPRYYSDGNYLIMT